MSLEYIIFAFALLFLTDSYLGLEQDGPLVETSLGPIKGHYKQSYGNCTFSAFEGIPYAKPPIGDLRFEEPVSAEPWSGTWNATLTHECIQLNFLNPESPVSGSEDCLYLNVYVPRERPIPNENLDVVVFIHGGAFMGGSPGLGGPEYLMDRNIVYVTINYRVGVMGFLSTGDDVVPGNMGMKDQVLALKWVQTHIDRFGGNPNSVTIIGLSAGGASVHLLYFSPLAKGLLHRGISQSGVALAPCAIQEEPLETTTKLAATIGCDSSDIKELVQCLKQLSATQVLQNSYDLSPYPLLPMAPFSPVVERKSKTAFLRDYPYKLLNRGEIIKVPWISSATTEDGSVCLMFLQNRLTTLNEEWDEMLPYFLDYNHTVNELDKPEVAQKIKEFYFGDEPVTWSNIRKLIQLCTDRYFVSDFEKSARLHAKLSDSPTYSYIYGYQGEHNFSGLADYNVVGHGDDGYLLYLITFGGSFQKDKLSESDERVKEVLVDMVVSFAKNGKPEVDGIEWDPVKNSGDFPYLFIHNDGIEMASKKELAPSEFWNSLPIKENEKLETLN